MQLTLCAKCWCIPVRIVDCDGLDIEAREARGRFPGVAVFAEEETL